MLPLVFGGGGGGGGGDLTRPRYHAEDSPPSSKRRSLEDAFAANHDDDDGDDDNVTAGVVVDAPSEAERVRVKREAEDEEDLVLDRIGGGGFLVEDAAGGRDVFVNGGTDGATPATTVVDGKTIYLVQVQDVKESRREDGRERKDIIVKMPATKSSSTSEKTMPEMTTTTFKTLRPIKPATASYMRVDQTLQEAVAVVAKIPPKG